MAKKPTLHPYSDLAAFERLLLLIATLVRFPGVGCPTGESETDPLEIVQHHLQTLAQDANIDLPACSLPTLRKDLATLRQYGILGRRKYQWGYYLGAGALNQEELQLALNALAAQAHYQGDPHARQVYHSLSQRLRGLDLQLNGEFFYPVRTHLNRVIVYTDPEEMAARRQHRETLFHRLEELEMAIIQGCPVELYRFQDPYRDKTGYLQVYPLQLVYAHQAWYFLYEEVETAHLAIARMDRFKNYLKLLNANGRGIEAQWDSLNVAHKLLENGWGLFLGEPDDQQLERQGKLPLHTIKVRFFPPVSQVIQEGERRHPRQKLTPGAPDPTTNKPAYVDYRVKLPGRSLDEFMRWIYGFMGKVQVLAPVELVEQHQQACRELASRYLYPASS
jgi:predicted DNA-binding transcriptional regulator YafY